VISERGGELKDPRVYADNKVCPLCGKPIDKRTRYLILQLDLKYFVHYYCLVQR
jgi:hypothetical protein